MIKIEHTLFSLPFVLTASLLAIFYKGYEFSNWQNFIWIVLALFAARSLGMTLNRIFDRSIDAKNPRTADRELPKGLISRSSAWVFASLSLVLLLYSALKLPMLCVKLAPIALAWLVLYSFLKRFTWLCHFFLGTTLGGATYAGWIAITGSAFSDAGEFLYAPIYLALAVSFWVAGFDIYYSLQDEEFDRKANLHSLPSKLGAAKAKMIARFSHFMTPVFLYMLALELGLGVVFKVGVALVIACLFYEQRLVDEGKIEKAFFTINTWISVLIFSFTLFEFLLRANDF